MRYVSWVYSIEVDAKEHRGLRRLEENVPALRESIPPIFCARVTSVMEIKDPQPPVWYPVHGFGSHRLALGGVVPAFPNREELEVGVREPDCLVPPHAAKVARSLQIPSDDYDLAAGQVVVTAEILHCRDGVGADVIDFRRADPGIVLILWGGLDEAVLSDTRNIRLPLIDLQHEGRKL